MEVWKYGAVKNGKLTAKKQGHGGGNIARRTTIA